ncbi:MAG: hypothetical protein MUO24_04105 [Desulfobacterales bacterium]|nr:hypothetical protein [Desulfobacterales bacterium]
MARARRARRKSTRRKSTRRTTTRRPKRATRRTRAKGLTRKAQKQILTVAAIVVGILILVALLQQGRSYVQVKYYAGEVARNAVYGKVTSVAIGALGRGTIHVQSFNTGKVYTFYTGVRTDFNIRRYPYAGETAKVYYVNDQGYLKATYVRIR